MARKIFLIAIALLILIAGCATAASAAADSTNDRVIVTSGTGTLTVTPGRAEVSLAVQTENVDAKTAQDQNAKQMNDCMSALLAAGFSRDDLQTTGYTIVPVYDESGSGLLRKVKLYQVTNTLNVKVKDVNQTGSAVDIAVANGANQVNSIRFMLSESQEQAARAQALQKAVAMTRADADTVAGALGIRIAGVKEVNVNSGYSPVMYESSNLAGAAMSRAVPTPINPGELTVTATVSVTYLIQ
jgi:uncharacterized protein YggE